MGDDESMAARAEREYEEECYVTDDIHEWVTSDYGERLMTIRRLSSTRPSRASMFRRPDDQSAWSEFPTFARISPLGFP